MKKILPGLFLTFLISFQLKISAQSEAEVKLGKPYEVVDAIYKEYFLVGENIVTIKATNKVWFTQILSVEGLTATKKVETVMKDRIGKRAGVVSYRKVDGKVYIFYSKWDKKSKQTSLYAMEVDSRTAQLKPEKKIITVPYEVGYFAFMRSLDNKRIGLRFSEVYSYKNRNDTKYGFAVINEELEELWRTEIEIPHDAGLYDNEHYTVTNQGDIYFITKYYASKIDKRKSEFDMELVSITEQGEVYDAVELKFDDFFIEDLLIKSEEGKDELYCAGYYRKEKRSDQTDGIMTFTITKNGEIDNLVKNEIPREVIDQFLTEAEKKINKKQDKKDGEVGFNNLRMDYAIFYDDGSISLVGEQRKIVVSTTTHTGPNGTYTTTTYHFYINNILATHINPEGEIDWMKVIPKRQYMSSAKAYATGTFRDLSYTMVESETGFHLVYFDHVKNLNLQPGEAPHKHVSTRGGYLTSAHIDYNGNLTKHSLFDVTDVKGMPVYQYAIDRIIETDDDKFIMEVYKKEKEDILIEVEF